MRNAATGATQVTARTGYQAWTELRRDFRLTNLQLAVLSTLRDGTPYLAGVSGRPRLHVLCLDKRILTKLNTYSGTKIDPCS
jgi:hypothetical protein